MVSLDVTVLSSSQVLPKCMGTSEIWGTPTATSGVEVSGDPREGRPPQVTGHRDGLIGAHYPLGAGVVTGTPRALGRTHPPAAPHSPLTPSLTLDSASAPNSPCSLSSPPNDDPEDPTAPPLHSPLAVPP